MPHFPALTYLQVIKKIKKCGFVFYRQGKGSHELWARNSDKKVIVIPRHQGLILKRKTLKKIIEATGLPADEFGEL